MAKRVRPTVRRVPSPTVPPPTVSAATAVAAAVPPPAAVAVAAVPPPPAVTPVSTVSPPTRVSWIGANIGLIIAIIAALGAVGVLVFTLRSTGANSGQIGKVEKEVVGMKGQLKTLDANTGGLRTEMNAVKKQIKDGFDGLGKKLTGTESSLRQDANGQSFRLDGLKKELADLMSARPAVLEGREEPAEYKPERFSVLNSILAMDDENSDTAETARMKLVVGGRDVAVALIGALDNRDSRIRKNAEEVLRNRGSRDCALLSQVLRNPDASAWAHAAAARVLGTPRKVAEDIGQLKKRQAKSADRIGKLEQRATIINAELRQLQDRLFSAEAGEIPALNARVSLLKGQLDTLMTDGVWVEVEEEECPPEK